MSAASDEAREALAKVLHDSPGIRWCEGPAVNPDCRPCHDDADAIIAAGWQSPEQVEDAIAAAERRGREDNAEHGMCYVFGSEALGAKLARVWDEGHTASDCECGHSIVAHPKDDYRNCRARERCGCDGYESARNPYSRSEKP